MKQLVVIFLVAMLVVSCGGDRRVDDVLSSADSLVFVAPDSAVRLLDSLPLGRASADQLDLYALLSVKAREKAGKIVSDNTRDSLLSRSIAALDRAADHYRGRGDSLEVQTLFYRGVLLGYRGNYSEALVSLMEAADRAADTGDNFYRAMAYSEQATLFDRLYSVSQSAEQAMLASEYFRMADRPLYAIREKIIASRRLVELEEPDSALGILTSVRRDSLLTGRAYLALYHRAMAEALYNLDNYEAALSHLDSVYIYAGKLSSIELSEKARILSATGQMRLAERSLEEAGLRAKTRNDTANLLYSSARLLARDGQYEKAYKTLVKFNTGRVTNTNHLLSHPYTTLLYKHFEDQSELNRNQYIQSRRFAWVLGTLCILLCLLIICVIVIFRYKIQRKKEQADMLIADIKIFKKQIENFKTQIKTSVSPNLVKHPFLSVINELCEFSDIYPLNDGGYMSLGKKTSSLVETFRNPKFFADLESFVNATNNNIMQRFRENFGQEKDKKLMIMLLLFAGFSDRFIMVVLRYNSLASVRTARSRIRIMILESTTKYKEEFLSYL